MCCKIGCFNAWQSRSWGVCLVEVVAKDEDDDNERSAKRGEANVNRCTDHGDSTSSHTHTSLHLCFSSHLWPLDVFFC